MIRYWEQRGFNAKKAVDSNSLALAKFNDP